MAALIIAFLPSMANAQTLYGERLPSRDGRWLLPVASRLLSSDTHAHTRRGSIPSWDINAPSGSPVYASAPGRVIYAGCNNSGGYGCWVKLDHGGGITSAYAHMVIGSIRVGIGQTVDANTVLGAVGWTGMTSFGPHVHFVIYRNGVHVDPAQVFNQSAMEQCNLCASPAGNASWRRTATTAQQTAFTGDTTGWRMVRSVSRSLAGMEQQTIQITITGVLFLILLLFWLSPNWLRSIIASVTLSTAATVTLIVLFVPLPTVASSPSGDWRTAYRFVAGSEGWAPTDDGAYTMGGITQGAYDRWRMSQGLPWADVKQSLTRRERELIFYQDYWLASGANRLPWPFSLTYVDHAFNAGIAAAKRGIAACGFDARCFNNWREREYRSMQGCRIYCNGWLNRVERIRPLTEVN